MMTHARVLLGFLLLENSYELLCKLSIILDTVWFSSAKCYQKQLQSSVTALSTSIEVISQWLYRESYSSKNKDSRIYP